jgi:hypothetical protein
MINIFRVEVSTNGRGHLLTSIDTNIDVKNKNEFEAKKLQLKSEYEKVFSMNDLTVYLSYTEK